MLPESFYKYIFAAVASIVGAGLGFIASRGRIRNEAEDVFGKHFEALAHELQATKAREHDCVKKCDKLQSQITLQAIRIRKLEIMLVDFDQPCE